MVTIGVTGHRQLNEVEQISSGVDEALHKIKETFPGENLTIISPLAEGADRLVVWRAMENNVVHLVVPLPLEISDYMLDFNSISSKAEFVTLLEQAAQVIELPAEEIREASYLAAGLYVLDHSDVLIAVWDGQPARGLGGTGQIVAAARKQKMPLAWVFASNHNQDTSSPTTPDKSPGDVTFENFP
ncbi:MAG: hypothetical protein IMY85_00450 [Chloroflexi bacterium]|nr:hypothetical protein [Chloroflexota bacterium]